MLFGRVVFSNYGKILISSLNFHFELEISILLFCLLLTLTVYITKVICFITEVRVDKKLPNVSKDLIVVCSHPWKMNISNVLQCSRTISIAWSVINLQWSIRSSFNEFENAGELNSLLMPWSVTWLWLKVIACKLCNDLKNPSPRSEIPKIEQNES